MIKSISRFITNDELWNEIHNCAKRKNALAAVAYLGRDAAKLLPLKNGDRLVVDMSLRAVHQGVTYPKAVRTLMSRGVEVFSRERLHAKFLVAGRTLIASSANVSQNSRKILDEAGIVTTDPAAVQRATLFFEKLCVERVGEKYLAKCIKEYRPPNFKAAVEQRSLSRIGKRVPQAKLWFLGGLVALKLSDLETASMNLLERRAMKRLKHSTGTDVRWIRYSGPRKFLRNIREGDWILDCMKDGETRRVGPIAQVLSQEKSTSPRGTQYSVLMLESPSRGDSVALDEFRKRVRSIEAKLDSPNPRTQAITSDELADKILRLWTLNGKFAK